MSCPRSRVYFRDLHALLRAAVTSLCHLTNDITPYRHLLLEKCRSSDHIPPANARRACQMASLGEKSATMAFTTRYGCDHTRH